MTDNVQDNTAYLLVQTGRAHRNVMEAALNPLGLHVGQDVILFRLWQEDGQPQSQLAVSLCVEPPTVNKMVQRMEQSGLVQRRPDPDDARISRVYLTAKGREMQTAVCLLWQEVERRLSAGMTLTEQALLRRMLMQMHSNLNPTPPVMRKPGDRE